MVRTSIQTFHIYQLQRWRGRFVSTVLLSACEIYKPLSRHRHGCVHKAPIERYEVQLVYHFRHQYGKSLDWKNEHFTTHDVASVFRRYLTQMPVSGASRFVPCLLMPHSGTRNTTRYVSRRECMLLPLLIGADVSISSGTFWVRSPDSLMHKLNWRLCRKETIQL